MNYFVGRGSQLHHTFLHFLQDDKLTSDNKCEFLTNIKQKINESAIIKEFQILLRMNISFSILSTTKKSTDKC